MVTMKPLRETSAARLEHELVSVNESLADVVEFAEEAHQGQTRKPDDTPYIEHPLRVAARLKRIGVEDERILTAAVLHDTVEDQTDRICVLEGVEPSRAQALSVIRRDFGSVPRQLVSMLSNTEGGSGYHAHVVDAVSSDPWVFLVKVSDWVDNAGGLHELRNNSRLVEKYAKLTPVFVEQFDEWHMDIQAVTGGNADKVFRMILGVGFRLELMRT